jgi:hypothetical protein
VQPRCGVRSGGRYAPPPDVPRRGCPSHDPRRKTRARRPDVGTRRDLLTPRPGRHAPAPFGLAAARGDEGVSDVVGSRGPTTRRSLTAATGERDAAQDSVADPARCPPPPPFRYPNAMRPRRPRLRHVTPSPDWDGPREWVADFRGPAAGVRVAVRRDGRRRARHVLLRRVDRDRRLAAGTDRGRRAPPAGNGPPDRPRARHPPRVHAVAYGGAAQGDRSRVRTFRRGTTAGAAPAAAGGGPLDAARRRVRRARRRRDHADEELSGT